MARTHPIVKEPALSYPAPGTETRRIMNLVMDDPGLTLEDLCGRMNQVQRWIGAQVQSLHQRGLLWPLNEQANLTTVRACAKLYPTPRALALWRGRALR